MTKRKNRTLNAIADDINKIECNNVFDIGDLLLEAKEQCEHGEWGDWLAAEFDWSDDTASRYMKVAKLSSKFRKLRDFKFAKSALYHLVDKDQGDDVLAPIIDNLAQRATDRKLRAIEAKRIIDIGFARHKHGDYPDATLSKIIDMESGWMPWCHTAIAMLKNLRPNTEADATEIITKAETRWTMLAKSREDEVEKEEAQAEAEAILDGPPPELPPSIVPGDEEPQKFEAGTAWADTDAFGDAVKVLLALRTKPAERFVGQCSVDVLQAVNDFLAAVVKATKQKETADKIETAQTTETTPEPTGTTLTWVQSQTAITLEGIGYHAHKAVAPHGTYDITVASNKGKFGHYIAMFMPKGGDVITLDRFKSLDAAKAAAEHAAADKAQAETV